MIFELDFELRPEFLVRSDPKFPEISSSSVQEIFAQSLANCSGDPAQNPRSLSKPFKNEALVLKVANPRVGI